MKKTRTKAGECDFHSCHNKSKISKCEYCERSFCSEHKKPKPAGLRRFKDSSIEAKKFEESRKDGGHPCFQYTNYFYDKLEKEKEDYGNALNKLLSVKKYKPIIVNQENPIRYNKPLSHSKEERVYEKKWKSKKITKHNKTRIKRWALILIVIFGIFYLWNNGYVEDYLAGNKHLGGIIENSLESKEMANLVFSGINDVRMEKLTHNLTYDRDAYNLAVFISKEFHKSDTYHIKDEELHNLSEQYSLEEVEILSTKLNSLSENEFISLIPRWTSNNIFSEKTLNGNFSSGAFGCYREVCVLVLSKKLGVRDSVSEQSSYNLGKFFGLNPPNNSLIEEEIFRMTNSHRNLHLVGLLKSDSGLNLIAKEHSEDMLVRDFYDHINPDGEGPTERAQRNGLRITSGGYIGIAENIAVVYVGNDADCQTKDEVKLGECLVKKWMSSPGHRQNILDENYNDIGVGVYCSTSECYATQNFR